VTSIETVSNLPLSAGTGTGNTLKSR